MVCLFVLMLNKFYIPVNNFQLCRDDFLSFWAEPQELDVAFFYTCIPFWSKREGRSLPCCTNCFWMSYTIIIQVTKSCPYSLNKQLHALSSALYQKLATFKVLLFFCFFNEFWLDYCDKYNRMFSLLCCVMYIHQSECVYHLVGWDDENILSSYIDQSDDTLHLLQYMHTKQQSIQLYPSQQSNHISF